MKALYKTAGITGRILFSALLILIFIVPFYWMILTAVKTLGEVMEFPPKFWVNSIRWQNFSEAFSSIDFLHYMKNSLFVTLGTLLGQVLFVLPASYAFARYDFKGKKFLFSTVLLTMMIPGQLIFLPVFVMYVKLGLINTYISLIIPFAANGLAIFLLRQTFMQVPDSILEAARLDNTSEFKIIYSIMLPMAVPTISTLGLFTFITSWNNYFFPLAWTTTDAVRTLPVGIQQLQDSIGLNPQVVMAGIVLMIAPILVLFVVARKQIIKAFTYMGIK